MMRVRITTLLVGSFASVLLAWAVPAAARVEVFVTPPAEVSVGEMFDVPVTVRDGSDDLVSYALRLSFDPAVLKVVAINGGTFAGFTDPPVANTGAFAAGEVEFTANNRGFAETSGTVIVATIKFQAIGQPSAGSEIRLSKSLRGDVTIKRPNQRFRRIGPRVSRAHGFVEVR